MFRSARLATFRPQHLGGGVFAVLLELVFFLTGRDPHDPDGIADHVGGMLLAFWSRGNKPSLCFPLSI